MEPSKAPGCGANLRQKWREFRGDKSRKESNQDADPSTNNECTSLISHNPSKVPAKDKSGSAGPAKAVEESGLFSPTEAIHQESPPEDDHALDRSDQKVTSPDWLTTIHNALWNKAYNNLKQDPKMAKYVEAYEKLVLAVFLETPISDEAGEGDEKKPDDARSNLGEEQMKAIVTKGLERVEVKAFIDIPLKNIPQTALPWAVISSTVDILVKPAKAAADFYNGVAYVVSRMSWYSKAVNNLLSDQNIEDNTSLEEMNHALKTGIVDLYQSMLFYQIKSVCFYYKSQLMVLLRGFLDVDDWSGNLNAVKDAENALQKDIMLYNEEHIKDQISQITITSEHRRELDEYQKCLQFLRWIDPRAEIAGIQARNENIIEELYAWILLTDEYRQFSKWDHPTPARLWISGQAGTGKTMLLIGIIKDLISCGLPNTEYPLVLYFFCQEKSDQANNGIAVLRSLIWLLLLEEPHLISHVQKEYFHSGIGLLADKNTFIILRDMFRKMLGDETLKRVVVVIDAMDECEQTSRELLTGFIDDASSAKDLVKVKWLISSRPLHEIPGSVQDVTLPTHSLLRLDGHDMSPSINRYIEIKMVLLKQKATTHSRVGEVADKLRAQASNTYIWVSLVCRELLRLDDYTWNEIIETIPKRLEDLYGYLLDRLANLDYRIMSLYCKRVLAAAMLALRPLALSEIAILADLPEGAAESVLRECRSFLTIRNSTVYLIHQSAQDYLRSHYQKLYDEFLEEHHQHLYDIPLATLHHKLYQRALNGLENNLKENIYEYSHYGIASVEMQIPNPDPLESVRYACRYWVYHLEQSGPTPADMEDILLFFHTHFLHWLEAMSLLESYPDLVRILGQLKSILETKNEPNLSVFLTDAERFVLQSLPIATAAPLQLYVSSLVFSPEKSRVRCMFEKQVCKWILRTSGADKEWGAVLQTLEHADVVESVVFSRDGRLVASGSYDHTVKIWDTATGSLQKILDHSSSVKIVKFSSDNKTLASLAGDGIIRLWDTISWREIERSDRISMLIDMTITPNKQILVTDKLAGVVRLSENGTWGLKWKPWDLDLRIPVRPIAVSTNEQLLATSIETGDLVALLDMETNTIVHRLVHSNNVTYVAFSPDSLLLGCRCSDSTMILWDTVTGIKKHTIREALPPAAFSSDSKLLAVNSTDAAVRLFNTESGSLQQTSKGHIHHVSDFAFSPNGELVVSGSLDKTVRLWRIIPDRQDDSLDHQSSLIHNVQISPNGLLVATCSERFIKIWNAEDGKLERTLGDHTRKVIVTAFSPNSRLLASYGRDAVRIWNIENGEQQWVFDICDMALRAINFIAENRLRATVLDNDKVLTWNTATGLLEKANMDDYEASMPNLSPDESQDNRAEFNISVDGEWVIMKQNKSIWLPPEYRPRSPSDKLWAIRGNTLVIGSVSGHVIFIWFDPDAMRGAIC